MGEGWGEGEIPHPPVIAMSVSDVAISTSPAKTQSRTHTKPSVSRWRCLGDATSRIGGILIGSHHYCTALASTGPIEAVHQAARIVLGRFGKPDRYAPRLELRNPPAADRDVVAAILVLTHCHDDASANVPAFAVSYERIIVPSPADIMFGLRIAGIVQRRPQPSVYPCPRGLVILAHEHAVVSERAPLSGRRRVIDIGELDHVGGGALGQDLQCGERAGAARMDYKELVAVVIRLAQSVRGVVSKVKSISSRETQPAE